MLRVKELAKSKGLSLADVANRMDMSPSGLSMALSRNMTLDVMKRIADALNVSVVDLFESTSKEELTALISYKGEFFKANTVEELEEVVCKIKML